MSNRKPANETSQVVKPILAWLSAQGFIVLDMGKKKDDALTGFRKAALMLSLSDHVRGVVWRSNTGVAMLRGAGGAMRPVSFGQPGQSDIDGILRGGRRLSIECKRADSRGKLSPQQEAFRDVMQAMGGVWIMATSIDDVAAGLEGAR